MAEKPPVVVRVGEDGVPLIEVSIEPEVDPADLVATNEGEPPPDPGEERYQGVFERRWMGL